MSSELHLGQVRLGVEVKQAEFSRARALLELLILDMVELEPDFGNKNLLSSLFLLELFTELKQKSLI